MLPSPPCPSRWVHVHLCSACLLGKTCRPTRHSSEAVTVPLSLTKRMMTMRRMKRIGQLLLLLLMMLRGWGSSHRHCLHHWHPILLARHCRHTCPSQCRLGPCKHKYSRYNTCNPISTHRTSCRQLPHPQSHPRKIPPRRCGRQRASRASRQLHTPFDSKDHIGVLRLVNNMRHRDSQRNSSTAPPFPFPSLVEPPLVAGQGQQQVETLG